MKIFSSNHLEALAEKIAFELREPLPDPLRPEIIIVQNRGMARWLTQQLAIHHQICANYKFPFPKSVAHRIFQALHPNLPDTSPFEPELLQWRIMRLLPEFLEGPEFKSVCQYLDGENKSLRLYQLSKKIAELFDQYLIYRPQMILQWDRGEEQHWQAVLWRELTQEIKSPHPAQLQTSALQALLRSRPDLRHLPRRLSLFGFSVLPDFYIQLFAALGKHCDIQFFVFQPSKEDWSHIASRREAARTVAKLQNRFTEEELHLEQGHPLLASWGTLGREFFKSLLETSGFETSDGELFVAQNNDSLLRQLQNDVLELNERPIENRSTVARNDDSIHIHSCHTPIRELEVLYDQMLDWFQRDPALKPRDIVVMMPDVESYAPFIQAVFDVPEDINRRIPFSIADRSAKTESQVAETFLRIFDLVDSRCTAREVLAILECYSLQQRFSISESEIELIAGWLKKSGIRWGLDEKHRASLDLPALSGNSWQEGLNRLLIGYAMAGRGEELFADLQPVDEIEGSNALTLGKFVEFTKQLFDFRAALNKPRLLSEWSQLLTRALKIFFKSDDASEHELHFLRKTLHSLIEEENLSDYKAPVDVAVIRSHLENLLNEESFSSGFLTGGVTFCGLKPLRSLPFKVICLLGMNDTDFPRQNASIGFDLMQKPPRPGDPSARKDDQYVLLEALLSARQKFYVSYIGQSVRDNKTIPPSVLISELLDCLKNSFRFEDGDVTNEDLVTKHRLQAFSPLYFSGGRHFSFSKSNAAAFLVRQNEKPKPIQLLAEPLSEATDEWREVTVQQLADFLCNPARFFVRHRLQIELSETPGGLEECEPFAIDGLDTFKLKERLIEQSLAGFPLEKSLSLLKASAQVPLGCAGESVQRELLRETQTFAKQLKGHLPAEPRPFVFDAPLGEFRLSGEIKISSSGLLHYRCAKMKAADILRAWVQHLVLNWQRPPDTKPETIVLASDEVRRFTFVLNAEQLLKDLLDLYWRGLREPLKIFPQSSQAYAKNKLSPRSRSSPISAAERAWFSTERPGGERSRGDEDDVWFQFCFRNGSPLDDEFAQLSENLFSPILQKLLKAGDGTEAADE